jgi:hypothetical protein
MIQIYMSKKRFGLYLMEPRLVLALLDQQAVPVG